MSTAANTFGGRGWALTLIVRRPIRPSGEGHGSVARNVNVRGPAAPPKVTVVMHAVGSAIVSAALLLVHWKVQPSPAQPLPLTNGVVTDAIRSRVLSRYWVLPPIGDWMATRGGWLSTVTWATWVVVT